MSKVQKYLRTYAESEIRALTDFPTSTPYTNVAVIPVYKETRTFFLRLLNSPLVNEKVLLILVINQPESDRNNVPQQALAQLILQSGKMLWQNHNLSLIQPTGKAAHVMLVNRYQDGMKINPRQGVGLARKIGADIATALISQNLIASPWIGSTDADTHLPDNYFSVLKDIPGNTSAITYNFNHKNLNDPLSEATQLYQRALEYYVAGMRWAGSGYAFHTIGSCLAFRYDYYAQVRGFPKRAAGEDFYLLNKLAKQARIRTLDESVITIEPRESDRVPFGTGPAVSKILMLDNPAEDYHYYHPGLFTELKSCLKIMDILWQYREQQQHWLKQFSEPSKSALEQLKINQLLLHIQSHAKNEAQCKSQVFQWFDAFRTLKYLHYIQEHYLSPMPLTKAIALSPFK